LCLPSLAVADKLCCNVTLSARRIAIAAGVTALLLLAHAGALNNSFHYDDIHSVVDNLHLRSLADPAAFFTDSTTFSARPERAMFRPLVVLSYALTYALAGLTPWAHLLVNVLTHLAAAGCVYVLSRLLRLPATAAAAAALVFALHPANTEVVNYVSSRSESLAGVGVLVALCAYLRWRSGEAKGSTVLLLVSLFAFALALLSKATAIALPAMLLVVELCRLGSTVARRRWLAVSAFAVVGLGYALIVAGFAQTAMGSPVRPLLHQGWTQLKAAAFYLRLLAMPVSLSVEHDFSVATSLADPVVLFCGAMLISGVVVGWRVAGIRSRVLVGGALFSLLPASLVPLNVLVNEHRLYVASALLAVAIFAVLGSRLPRSGGLVLGAGLLIILSLLSHQRSQVWEDEHLLWGDAVRTSPHAYRAHLHFGGAQEQRGEIVAALDSYRRAAALAPKVAETHYNVGNALRLTNRMPQARKAWERSLQLDHNFIDALLNLAAFHQGAGDWEKVWSLLGRAEAARPNFAEVWRRKGLARKVNGDLAGAKRDYLRALELDPSRSETQFNLANLYFEEGQMSAAAGHYELALQHNPAHHGAATNLGLLHIDAGNGAAAEKIARNMLRLDALRHTAGQSKLFYVLARALDAQGKTAEALINYRVFLRTPQAARTSGTDEIRQRVQQLEAGLRQ
jgi:tetratricopeptide (TPR) repeat protein